MHSRALASLYLSIQRVIRGLTGIKHTHTYIRPDPLFPAYAYRHPFSIGLSLKKKKKKLGRVVWPRREGGDGEEGREKKKKQIPRKEFFVSSSPPSVYALSVLLLCSARGAVRPLPDVLSDLFLSQDVFASPEFPSATLSYARSPSPMIEKFFCRVFISLQPCETKGEEERLGGGKRIYIYVCMYV